MLRLIQSSQHSARVQIVVLAMITLLSLSLLLVAWPGGGPAWWAERNLLQQDAEGYPIASEDYAAANQGQLKNFAVSAYEDFLTKVSPQLGGLGDLRTPAQLAPNGGTGYRLRVMVKQWVQIDETTGAVLRDADGKRKLAMPVSGNVPNDFVAINLGQLKAVAKPFYDRLLELNSNEAAWKHPWNTDGGTVNDFAQANLGQLKRVFSFDVKKDDDGDGLSNLEEMNWKVIHGGGQNYDPNNPDMDEDGVLDGTEVMAGTNPLEFYNGINPGIQISAPKTKGLRNTALSAPIAVRIYRKSTDSTGNPITGDVLKNAPISVSVDMGSIAMQPGAAVADWTFGALDMKTDWNGWALVWVRLPDVIGKKCKITVKALNEILHFPLETFPQLAPPVFGEVYEGMDGIVEVKAGTSDGVTTDVPISSSPGLKIHYRVDGSLPDAYSPYTFSQGLIFSGSGVHNVNARAYAPNFEPSVVVNKSINALLNTPVVIPNSPLPAYGLVSVILPQIYTKWRSGSTQVERYEFGLSRQKPQYPEVPAGTISMPPAIGWLSESAGAGYVLEPDYQRHKTQYPQIKPGGMGGITITNNPGLPGEWGKFMGKLAYDYDFSTKPFTVFYVSALHNLSVLNQNSSFNNYQNVDLLSAAGSKLRFGFIERGLQNSSGKAPWALRYADGTLEPDIASYSTLKRPSPVRENQNFIAEVSWDGEKVEGYYNGLRQYSKLSPPLNGASGGMANFFSILGAYDPLKELCSEFACAIVYNRKLSWMEREKVYRLLRTRENAANGRTFTSLSGTQNPVPTPSTLKISTTDTDQDWLPDWREAELGTSSTLSDSDGDGISDYAEACIFFTDPVGNDTDGDRMLDREEVRLKGVNPIATDGSLDPDGDGLSNFREVLLRTNPIEADSDGDGFEDGYEINNGSSPSQVDRVPSVTIVYNNSLGDSGTYGGPNGSGNEGGGDGNGGDEGDDGTPGSDGSAPDSPYPNYPGNTTPLPPGSIALKLGVGDVSSSHSEDYEIIVKRRNAVGAWEHYFSHRSGGKGQYSELSYPNFNVGEEYSFEIGRLSGTDVSGDYDYRMVIVPDDSVANNRNNQAILVDPENILCDPEPESLTIDANGYLTATNPDTDSFPDQQHNKTSEWIDGSKKVNLLRVELRDIKDHANTGDDVTIANWDTTQNIADNNIAWIEAHSTATDTVPRMPQLELRIPGLRQSITIEAKLEVQYNRGNGQRMARNQLEDRTRIPDSGNYQSVTGDTWRIWEGYANQTFFGGEAVLTYRLMNGQNQAVAPQTVRFRIGGKNPDSARARQFIESLNNAGLQEPLWFAYAIAKSESKDYNGTGTRYNQFWQLPRGANDTAYRAARQTHVGRPVWGDDGGTTPGGYGMFQVTGNSNDSTADIPRQVIWNWQDNARAGLAILESKRTTADTWMTRQKNANNANGIVLPSLTVRNVIFAEGSNRTINNAVTMKAWNGASAAPAGFIDRAGAAPGFIIDPQGGGHYCYWKNAASGTSKWALSRFNNPPGSIQPFNYVDRVCEEVE